MSNSIDNISIDKKLGDSLNQQIRDLKKSNIELRDQLQDQTRLLATLQ